MPVEYVISAFVTLIVVVDPLGLVPTFLALTEGMADQTRRHVGILAAVIAVCILTGFALGGEWLLQKLAIGLPAFRIAGGLLLFSIASEMVFGVRTERQSRAAEKAAEEHAHNIAAFPIAIPLMAGPGAITAVVLLSGRANGDLALLALLLGVIVVVGVICLGAFMLAPKIGRLIGNTGNVVLSRLLGVLLAAMAAQFVIDGVRILLTR
jgi:multiple antibiotic resistance protein